MDPRLLGYLNRALGHEMAAVQQYMAQSRLCDLWQLADYCSHFHQDVIEELGHVASLTDALLKLEHYKQGLVNHAAEAHPASLFNINNVVR